jgi:hypothetical protein
MFKLLTDSLFVAICRSNWLYSRKYGTVWYHPASSKFYQTVFILCQFQGKLTGTLPNFDTRATCVKPANPACCVLGVRCWFYVNSRLGWNRFETAAPRRDVVCPRVGRFVVRAAAHPKVRASSKAAPSPGRPVPHNVLKSSPLHASAAIHAVPWPRARRTVHRSVPCLSQYVRRPRSPPYHDGIVAVTQSSPASRSPI